jgi:phenylacetate-CoA ligase
MNAQAGQEVYARFAANLERTERMPRSGLDKHRDELLGRVVSFAFANSPFYRNRLKALFRSSAEPNLHAWHEVPLLRRSDLETEIDRINPAEVPPELGEIMMKRTSGSTGNRLSFRSCSLVRTAEAGMMNRLYRWWNFDVGAPMASIRNYTAGNTYPDGGERRQWSFPGPDAPHYTLHLGTSADNMIEWLSRRQPTYLMTYPSIAHELAEHPQAQRIVDAGLKGIVSLSEVATEDARAAVARVFGFELAQIYGCSEMGALALQSPGDGGMLVCEEAVLVEILDDSGRPVGPGETGRVVLTSFYNYATPFIRYEIGDYATRAEGPCPSGRSLNRIKSIDGRGRNALRASGGRKIWHWEIEAADILRHLPARRFQIRQPEAGMIELVYVPATQRAPDAKALADYFSARLEWPIVIRLLAVDEIARTAGGKYERIVSMLV